MVFVAYPPCVQLWASNTTRRQLGRWNQILNRHESESQNVNRGGKMKSLIFTKRNCLAKVSGRSGSGCNHVFPERWKTIIEAIMGFNHDHSGTWSLGASAANTGSLPTRVWQQLLFSCDFDFFGARPIFYRDGGSPHTRLNQTGECY